MGHVIYLYLFLGVLPIAASILLCVLLEIKSRSKSKSRRPLTASIQGSRYHSPEAYKNNPHGWWEDKNWIRRYARSKWGCRACFPHGMES